MTRSVRSSGLWALICLVLATTATAAYAKFKTADVEDSIVRVFRGERDEIPAASGVVVSPDGYILTSYEIATDMAPAGGRAPVQAADDVRVELTLDDKEEDVPAQVVEFDAGRGIALLKIDRSDLHALALSKADRESGLPVHTLGIFSAPPGVTVPTGMRRVDAVVTSSGRRPWISDEQRQTLTFDENLFPGASGGPVLDECGVIVAVNWQAIPAPAPGMMPRGAGNQPPPVEEEANDNDETIALDVNEVLPLLDRNDAEYVSVTEKCQTGFFAEMLDTAKAKPGLAALAGLVLLALPVLAIFTLRPKKHASKRRERSTDWAKAPNSPPASTDPQPGSTAAGSQAPASGGGIHPTGHDMASIERWELAGSIEGQQLRYRLDPEKLRDTYGVVFGRAGGIVDIAIDDALISRRHFRLFSAGGKLFVEDLNSTNGTAVNGARVAPFQPVEIGNGGRIAIGESEFLLGEV